LAPGRTWLVYAHAPLGDHRAVEITLPGYGAVTADVPRAGVFLVVEEASRSVEPLRTS